MVALSVFISLSDATEHECELRFLLLPGVPDSLRLVSELSSEIVDGKSLPNLLFSVLDRWGNRCTPLTMEEQWVVELTLEGGAGDLSLRGDEERGAGALRQPVTAADAKFKGIKLALPREAWAGGEGGRSPASLPRSVRATLRNTATTMDILFSRDFEVRPDRAPTAIEVFETDDGGGNPVLFRGNAVSVGESIKNLEGCQPTASMKCFWHCVS
jgi:hypothetical protein